VAQQPRDKSDGNGNGFERARWLINDEAVDLAIPNPQEFPGDGVEVPILDKRSVWCDRVEAFPYEGIKFIP
jgi:hypothetical protein